MEIPPKRATDLCLHYSWRLCGLKRCLADQFYVAKISRRSDFSKIELVKRSPETAKSLNGICKAGRGVFRNDLSLSPEFDLMSELLNGRVMALKKRIDWSVAIPERLNTHVLFL